MLIPKTYTKYEYKKSFGTDVALIIYFIRIGGILCIDLLTSPSFAPSMKTWQVLLELSVYIVCPSIMTMDLVGTVPANTTIRRATLTATP
ncbi:hypothetical protein B0O99DRAFT_638003 [Bisporella sp. PMI_857]|nr:hypothetical protein B0O99DRAFT_638003 [Bisporella sp. PMI_857]